MVLNYEKFDRIVDSDSDEDVCTEGASRLNSGVKATLLDVDLAEWGRLAGADLFALRDHARASPGICCAVRSGLPHLQSLLAAWRSGRATCKPRIAYVGGSITAQRDGWKNRVHSWLTHEYRPNENVGLEQVNVAVGNVGSKVISFLTDEWIIEHAPDIVFLETVVNDGDSLLEDGDSANVRRALEGIVRRVRTKLPRTEIVFVYMLLRGDVPTNRRTGTKAWADGGVGDALCLYHRDAVAIHEAVAEHYGCPSINVIGALKWAPSTVLDRLFRDDCHHTPAGASLVASVVGRALQTMLGSANGGARDGQMMNMTVPSPLDARLWSSGEALKLAEAQVAFKGGTRQAHHTRLDLDPITGKPDQWWLLSPGDMITFHFAGTAVGLLTHLGPDAGVLEGSLSLANGDVLPLRCKLFDSWCYYYRLGVVILAEGLPAGSHTLRLRLSAAGPDRSCLKRPLSAGPGPVQGTLKLWVAYMLVMRGGWVDTNLPIAAYAYGEGDALPAANDPTYAAEAGREGQTVAPRRHGRDTLAVPSNRVACHCSLSDIDE